MKRFWVALMLMIVGVSLFAGGQQEIEKSTDPWKQFAGEELNVVSMNITFAQGLEKYLPEFEEKTGLKVNLDLFSEDMAHQKIKTELASGSGAYDVVWVQSGYSIPYASAGWLESLDPYISSSEKSMQDVLEFDDIIPSLVEMMKYDGSTYGIPFFAATIITYYRSDILREKGIDPSMLDTIDGFYEAVKLLNSADMAGVAMRGDTMNTSWHSTVFMKGLGGTYVKDIKNEDYTPTLNSEAVIESTKLYADMMANYGIDGAATAKYDDVVLAIQQGNAAIAIEGAPLAGRILDPELSKVVGKIGFRVVPAGPGGQYPAFTGHGLGITSASKNKDAAWLFLQWANSFDIVKKIALNTNHLAVQRSSVWNDSEFRERWNLEGEGDFLKTFEDSLAKADPDYRPRFAGFNEINQAYGEAVNKVIIGKSSAEDACEVLQEKALEVVRRFGYID